MFRRILRALGVGRRYGVRFGGEKERTGFTSRTAAETFGQNSGRSYVVFHYEPAIDMRIDTRRASSGRDRYVGGGAQ